MAKAKKPAKSQQAAETAPAPADPHAALKQPADPPRPRLFAFLLAIAAFFVWFVYLVYVAIQ